MSSNSNDLGALFGVAFKRTVPVTVPALRPGMQVPAREEYTFSSEMVKFLFAWDAGHLPRKNLLLTGPTGSGKTSLIEQYAARMNREVIRVGCHGRMEFQELLGGQRLTRDEQGGVVTTYQDGPLVTAMRQGAILLLDEANFLSPAVVGGLNGVLDGAPLLNPDTGEVIRPHAGFRIAATGNAVDGGADAANYRGAQKQNIALLDRYLAVEVDYMSPQDEAKILHRAAGNLTGEVIDLLVRVAAEVRTGFKEGSIGATLSTRVLVAWGRMLEMFAGDASGDALLEQTKNCLGYALTNRVNKDDRFVIEGLLVRLWSGSTKARK